MKPFGAIVCYFKGHKRGKRVSESWGAENGQMTRDRVFRCPRCGRETRYKVKSENGGTPGDEA